MRFVVIVFMVFSLFLSDVDITGECMQGVNSNLLVYFFINDMLQWYIKTPCELKCEVVIVFPR